MYSKQVKKQAIALGIKVTKKTRSKNGNVYRKPKSITELKRAILKKSIKSKNSMKFGMNLSREEFAAINEQNDIIRDIIIKAREARKTKEAEIDAINKQNIITDIIIKAKEAEQAATMTKIPKLKLDKLGISVGKPRGYVLTVRKDFLKPLRRKRVTGNKTKRSRHSSSSEASMIRGSTSRSSPDSQDSQRGFLSFKNMNIPPSVVKNGYFVNRLRSHVADKS
jgi:hypothetical protein